MTLEQIDKRLTLFTEYQRSRIDSWMLQPFGLMYTFRTTGIMFMGKLLTFDEWLYDNGYNDLINN